MDTSNDESTVVKVAGIGLGPMGIANLRSASRAGAEVVALCDVDTAQMAKLQEQFPEASLYTDYRELLAAEDIDGVIVSTPNHSHAVICLAAMKLGRHIYCEKPLAQTMLEVRRLTETNLPEDS